MMLSDGVGFAEHVSHTERQSSSLAMYYDMLTLMPCYVSRF